MSLLPWDDIFADQLATDIIVEQRHSNTQAVPAGTAYGANTLSVTDGALTGTTSFIASQPTISTVTTSGPVGSTVTVNGAGWVPNSTVILTRQGITALAVQANASGGITGQLPVPSSLFAAGAAVSVIIGANDGGVNGNVSATVTWTMNAASITISPASVRVGGSITVSGTGFLPFTGVTALTIGGIPVLGETPTTTGSTGEFSTSFPAPGLPGVQTVVVTLGATTQTAPVAVTPAAGGAGQPMNTDSAVQVLTASGNLEIITSFNYTTNSYQAFVPGLAGNPLAQIQPNSVIILTLTADSTIVVSGVPFTVTAGVPTPVPVGNTVSISLV